MKKVFLFFIYFAITFQSKAQQYPLFTNYVVNNFGFNPAIAGTAGCTDIKVSHRQQWTGVTENPRTSILTGHTKLKKRPIGIGGIAYSDNAGSLRRVGGSGVLSYVMQLDSQSYLGIGASGGYYSLHVSDNARVTNTNDPTITNGQAGKGFADFNAGVYFKRKGLWAGFSTPQILERKINFTNPLATTISQLKRHYYLMAGYQFPISSAITLEPSALMRYVDNAPLSFDISAKMTFNKQFWVGALFRNKDAVSAMAGMQMKNGINFYYSYDMTTSLLRSKSTGSHEFGIGVNLCKKNDRDGDGTPDEIDKCPDEKGTKANEGCPEKKDEEKEKIDTDKDGVMDFEDQCPNTPGPKENKGCPFADRDRDGLRDDIDKCPDIPGIATNEGCPLKDSDRDGIIDDKDPCPNEYGEIANFGCPVDKLPESFDPNAFMESNAAPGAFAKGTKKFAAKPGDRDGDGVPDRIDPCPNTPGSNGEGCPDIPIKARNALDFACKNIYFSTDKAEITAESNDYLDNLANWMIENPEYNVDMQGHTDNRYTAEYNLDLSKNRVNNVRQYLIDKGVESTRIKAQWYGETRPVASGNNEKAWRKNRRVEMQWRFN